jgi:hypothetical protein
MLAFVPLHFSVVERNPNLYPWVQSWLRNDAELLSPEQWFSRGHSHDGGYYDEHGFWRVKIKSGKFIWAPPPGAADIAVEELREAIIKRRDCTHVFLCPRLLTPQWRRHLNKACDLVLLMGAGSEIWPVEMFEPLTIGRVFPFLSVRPWQVRVTPKILSLGQSMPGMLKYTNLVPGDLLRKLCEQMWSLLTLPENVVQRVLYFASNNSVSCETERRI